MLRRRHPRHHLTSTPLLSEEAQKSFLQYSRSISLLPSFPFLMFGLSGRGSPWPVAEPRINNTNSLWLSTGRRSAISYAVGLHSALFHSGEHDIRCIGRAGSSPKPLAATVDRVSCMNLSRLGGTRFLHANVLTAWTGLLQEGPCRQRYINETTHMFSFFMRSEWGSSKLSC